MTSDYATCPRPRCGAVLTMAAALDAAATLVPLTTRLGAPQATATEAVTCFESSLTRDTPMLADLQAHLPWVCSQCGEDPELLDLGDRPVATCPVCNLAHEAGAVGRTCQRVSCTGWRLAEMTRLGDRPGLLDVHLDDLADGQVAHFAACTRCPAIICSSGLTEIDAAADDLAEQVNRLTFDSKAYRHALEVMVESLLGGDVDSALAFGREVLSG